MSEVDGDAAWMLTSTALVYMMTPALAFFYGGLVDHKNIINQLFLSFICMGMITVQWILFGYSFAFHPKTESFGSFYWGALNFEHLKGVDSTYSPTYSQLIHAMYQGAFAVITPALISGSVVGRMRLRAYVIFIFVWTTIVYDFLAHAVWAQDGWLRKMGALDFAGGTVIHISSGFSGLVAAMILGKRVDHDPKTPIKPAHIPFTVLGAGLLWVGWAGFNGGSAGAANGLAGLALVNTNGAAAISLLTWTALDALRHKASIVGSCTGAVVGLVVITPAAGFVSPGYAILMGFIGTLIVYGWICLRVKLHFTVDDTLDAFSCHGLGGVVGALLTGLFAEAKWGGVDGAFFGNGVLLWYQIAGVLTAIGWSVAITTVTLYLLQWTVGIRVSEEKEKFGLDHHLHGEKWEIPSLVSAEMSVPAKKASPSLLAAAAGEDHKAQMDLNESNAVILSSFNNTATHQTTDDGDEHVVTIRTDDSSH